MSTKTRTYGVMGVDWEARVDFERLRTERLARAKRMLAESSLGALLCFDMNNIRYLTATHIGTWALDKAARFALLPQDGEPVMWDFGSAARHHKLYCPWLGEERSRAGISTMRGSFFGNWLVRAARGQYSILGASTSVPVAEPGARMVLQIGTSQSRVIVAALTDVGFVELRLVKVVGLRVQQDNEPS